MNLDIGNMLIQGVKNIGESLLKELKNYMSSQNLTENAKIKVQENRNKIINNYADIYEIRNGEISLYSKDNINPEFIESTNLQNGFYNFQDGEYVLDQELTNKINQEIELSKQQVIEEEKKFIESQKVDGEEYKVDEIGDDEKYVFLTRTSNGTEFQEFISDDLYKELLMQNNKSDITLVYTDGKYTIKN